MSEDYVKGCKIQGIYFLNSRSHRIQSHSETQEASLLIALVNVLFLNRKINYNEGGRRVEFEELKTWITEYLENKTNGNDTLQISNEDDDDDDDDDDGDDVNTTQENDTKKEEITVLSLNDTILNILSTIEKESVIDIDSNEVIDLFNNLEIAVYNDGAETINDLSLIYNIIQKEDDPFIFYYYNEFQVIVKHHGILFEFVTNEHIVDIDPQITWKTLLPSNNDEMYFNNKFLLIDVDTDKYCGRCKDRHFVKDCITHDIERNVFFIWINNNDNNTFKYTEDNMSLKVLNKVKRELVHGYVYDDDDDGMPILPMEIYSMICLWYESEGWNYVIFDNDNQSYTVKL